MPDSHPPPSKDRYLYPRLGDCQLTMYLHRLAFREAYELTLAAIEKHCISASFCLSWSDHGSDDFKEYGTPSPQKEQRPQVRKGGHPGREF
jgi:hypothetical protein